MRKTDEMCQDMSLCAERFSESHIGAIITCHNREHSFDGVEPRIIRRTEKQFCLDRICKISNTSGMMKYYVVQKKIVASLHGNVFNDAAKWVLLNQPSLRAKLRPTIVSTTSRTDDDILVPFEFDHTNNGHPAQRIPIHFPIVP